MALFLGFDTSNYKTSAAIYDTELKSIYSAGRLLSVRDGEKGLRQNEAVYKHVKLLPDVFSGLSKFDLKNVAGVASSAYPRDAEGSFMPCFLVGKSIGRVVADLLRIPYYEFSHQCGHIVSACFSAGCPELLRAPFLSWHLSGGTTELLYVSEDSNKAIKTRIIGKTLDLAAGQLIDRAGNMLGLSFPAGPMLEELAYRADKHFSFTPKITGLDFSLSGLENKVKRLKDEGETYENIAYFAIKSVSNTVLAVSQKAVLTYKLPVVCSGGVMANSIIREDMKTVGEVFFASKELSGDNALGIAILASLVYKGL